MIFGESLLIPASRYTPVGGLREALAPQQRCEAKAILGPPDGSTTGGALRPLKSRVSGRAMAERGGGGVAPRAVATWQPQQRRIAGLIASLLLNINPCSYAIKGAPRIGIDEQNLAAAINHLKIVGERLSVNELHDTRPETVIGELKGAVKREILDDLSVEAGGDLSSSLALGSLSRDPTIEGLIKVPHQRKRPDASDVARHVVTVFARARAVGAVKGALRFGDTVARD